MPDVHARLSASGAKRWIQCPRSVKLEEMFPEETSEFAEEGTQAHALAEKLLKIFKSTKRREFTDIELEVLENGEKTPVDMKDAVTRYLSYIISIYDRLSEHHKDVDIYIEQRVDFSKYVREGFGTCDCIIIAGNELHIIDYKHGKGVPVPCKENPQPRLYALGAIHEFEWEYPLEHVTTHIVQPRIGNFDHEELTVDFLKEYGEKVIYPAAETAWNDGGEFSPGDVCQFCKARGLCRARAYKALESFLRIRRLVDGR